MFKLNQSMELNLAELFSKVWKTLETLPLNRKRLFIVVVCAAIAALSLLVVSCGTTRTVVRTQGKGSTNAQISVTTNNPTSVSVETQLDSTRLQINKVSN